jgi:hypothetical protein
VLYYLYTQVKPKPTSKFSLRQSLSASFENLLGGGLARKSKEKAEKERLEKERLEKERLEKERSEKERSEKERSEKERESGRLSPAIGSRGSTFLRRLGSTASELGSLPPSPEPTAGHPLVVAVAATAAATSLPRRSVSPAPNVSSPLAGSSLTASGLAKSTASSNSSSSSLFAGRFRSSSMPKDTVFVSAASTAATGGVKSAAETSVEESAELIDDDAASVESAALGIDHVAHPGSSASTSAAATADATVAGAAETTEHVTFCCNVVDDVRDPGDDDEASVVVSADAATTAPPSTPPVSRQASHAHLTLVPDTVDDDDEQLVDLSPARPTRPLHASFATEPPPILGNGNGTHAGRRHRRQPSCAASTPSRGWRHALFQSVTASAPRPPTLGERTRPLLKRKASLLKEELSRQAFVQQRWRKVIQSQCLLLRTERENARIEAARDLARKVCVCVCFILSKL